MSDRDQALASVPLFANLPQETRDRLGRIMIERQYEAGRDIVNAGEMGAGFFLITSGTVEALGKDGQQLNSLRKGDYFGDISLLDGRPRSATIRASEPTTCLVMTRWDFMAEVKQNPEIALELLAEMAHRLRAAEARA